MLPPPFAVLFLVLALPAEPVAAQSAPVRAEVPIRPVVLPDGIRRYSVQLTIDGQPVEAQLDTGSTGLRVLKSGLAGEASTKRGSSVHYSYGSGVELVGAKISANVAFTGLPSMAVPIERVETVECTARKSDCPASKLSAVDFRIGGDGNPGQGFLAIIGTGLRSDPVPNPLIALGVRQWIVNLPRQGEREGKLILNPNADDIARFRFFDVIGDSNQIRGCLVRTDTNKRICGPAIVDTGASGLRVQGGKPDEMWPNGSPAAIAIGDGSGTASFAITIGRRDQASGMFAYPRRAGSDITTLNLGLAPFFQWSVIFDASRRRIGVLTRPPL